MPRVLHFVKAASGKEGMGEALVKAGRPQLATHLTDGTDLQVSLCVSRDVDCIQHSTNIKLTRHDK